MSGPIASKRRMRFGGGVRTASKKDHHWKRAEAARFVMDGYPIRTPFTDPVDVWDYLSADRITCLRCGKAYKALAPSHLRVHGWTEEQYKEFYGLPWSAGLTSSATEQLNKETGRKKYEALLVVTHDQRLLAKKARRAPRRKRAPYLKAVSVLNGAKAPTNDRARVEAGEFKIWHAADYWRVLDRSKAQDRAPTNVCSDHDMPGSFATLLFARENPGFSRAYEETWEKLSFPVQARGQHLGGRFRDAVVAMRQKEMTAKEIGRCLGVHWVTVEKHMRRMRSPAHG